MKILMIIPTLDFGGAQNIAVGLAEEAYLKGYSIYFISFFGSNLYSDRLSNIDAKVVNLKFNYSFSNPFMVLNLSKKLKNNIKLINPDLIHTHLFLTKLLLSFNLIKHKAPIIDTQHDMSPWWTSRGANNKLKTSIEKYFANKKATYIVAISKNVRDGVKKHLNVPSSKVEVIYNFVEPYIYKNQLEKPKSEIVEIYMITRLDMQKKGLDLVISIISYLVYNLKVTTFKINIVGDGPDRVKLEQLVSENKLHNYFNFEGYKKNVYKYYNMADIIMLTSRWEGFGLTAAEAAMSGTAALAFDVPGLNEVIKNNETGLLVPAFNTEKYAEKLADLIHDIDLRHTLSRNAKVDAKKRFNKANAFNKYNEKYNYYTENKI
ncbi:glycosyltransferase [Pseudotamlana agarivorans]|uniref:glycosyltransferase n=1 Tax=Pseudotamlana agarivorans TaxID=481183 RepID=UPI000835EABA|nr:glycosyltransferase [Tamlana agarivorans]